MSSCSSPFFNVIGKSSSLIGPLISSAIIDATPGATTNSAAFYFPSALGLVSAVGIWGFPGSGEEHAGARAFPAPGAVASIW